LVQEEKSVNITFETLFEMLRLEKGKEELQKLDITFYQDVITYLREKYVIMKDIKNSEQTFSEQDKENIEKQILNIKRVLRDLYDRREKKIISMAINKARVNANLVDMQNMLSEETRFFESLVSLLVNYRKEILFNILDLKLPKSDTIIIKEEIKGQMSNFISASALKEIKVKNKTTVRFTCPVPKFVGPELEEYGPFENEDIAILPTEVVNVLVFKGRAEIIDQN